MDAPPLRAGRRIHPARRGHRGVPETGNRQARHPLARQPAARLRNPAEQVLLPLPAAHACERPAGRVLAFGEGGGENVGGAGSDGMTTYTQLKSSGVDWLGKIPTHWRATSLKRITTIQTGLTL